MSLLSETRMDKTVFSTTSLHDEPDDDAFWRRQSPQAILVGLELLRQINYGYDPDTTRLQRLLETAEYTPR